MAAIDHTELPILFDITIFKYFFNSLCHIVTNHRNIFNFSLIFIYFVFRSGAFTTHIITTYNDTTITKPPNLSKYC